MGAGHSHAPGPADEVSTRRIRRMVLAWCILVVFFVVEVTVALAIGSLGLLADAGHMLTDIVGMSMGLIALTLARRGSASAARTFGWHRAEVLSAVLNAALLLGLAVFVFVEAIRRIGDQPDIPGLALVLTAAAGLAANIAVMLLIRADAADSIAVRGAYLEVLADTVGSVGVLIAGFAVLLFGWTQADIVVGIAISLWVVPRAVRLAGQALRILTQTGPPTVDIGKLGRDLGALEGVADVHDLHVWTLTTGMDVATVHLTVVRRGADTSAVLTAAQAVLAGYGLDHATVQVEAAGRGEACRNEMTW